MSSNGCSGASCVRFATSDRDIYIGATAVGARPYEAKGEAKRAKSDGRDRRRRLTTGSTIFERHSLSVYSAVAFLGLTLFGRVRHVMPIYFGRLRLRNLTLPPPPFRVPRKKDSKRGPVAKLMMYYFGWIPHVLSVDDKKLISTAGLDAFAFLRVCQFGLQLFLPLAMISVVVLLPLHINGDDLSTQHDDYMKLHPNSTAQAPGGLLLTTVANISSKRSVLWLHAVGMWLTVLYTCWLLKQHTATFVILRTLYLTTRGDTNLWQVVHQPSNFIEQMLVQGTRGGAEINDDDLRKVKSATSDEIGDALSAMEECKDEHTDLLSRAVELTAKSTKNLLTAARNVRVADTKDSSDEEHLRRHDGDELTKVNAPPSTLDRRSSGDRAPLSRQTPKPSLRLREGISPFDRKLSRQISLSQVTGHPVTVQGNVAQGLKGAGKLKSSASPDGESLRQRLSTSPTSPGSTPTAFNQGQGSFISGQASSREIKIPPGPVIESKQISSFTSGSGEGLGEIDLSINPPLSEPPSAARRKQRKLRLGSFGSLGALPASVSGDLQQLTQSDEIGKGASLRVGSKEDLTRNELMRGLVGDMKRSESLEFLCKSSKKSPRRNKHQRMPTFEDFKLDDVALTPAVKKALARVRSMENARDIERTSDEDGSNVRSEIAISHDWWVGLDITREYERSLREDPGSCAIAASPPQTQEMRNEINRSLAQAFGDVAGRIDSPLNDAANSPVTRASMAVGDHLSHAPSAVPDVNSIRTVNAYDQTTKELVSVWASSYTVLITDIPYVRAVNEDGDEVKVRGLRQVEATLEYIYGDEFRGLIPVFDHRPVDALLDSYDACKNALTRVKLRMAREGILPEVTLPGIAYKFGKRLCAVKDREEDPWMNWSAFTCLFSDLLRRPKKLNKLSLPEQVVTLEAQLRALDESIVTLRKMTWDAPPGPSCFAVFENQLAASTAAQCVISRASHRIYRALPAPGPDDINWQTLLRTTTENRRRALMVWPIILFLMMFPTGMFSTTVTSFCKLREEEGFIGGSTLGWYCSADGKYARSIISGVLPPVLLTLWEVFVISFYMLYLVQKQNTHVSLSATDRRFLRFYFAWSAVNVVVGGIFGGSLALFTTTLGKSDVTFSEVQQQFGRVVPLSSNFFLLFIVFRAVYLPVQRLLLPHPGSICLALDIFWCQKRGTCARTARDRTLLYSPRAVRMGREIGVFLLIMLIGLTFVNIAPLIPSVCVLFYITNFVIWRYHVLYVYERGYESNGAVWFVFTQLVLLSLLIAQTFLSCVLFSKEAYIQGGILYLTVPQYLFRVYNKLRSEYGSASSWSVPLSEATAAPPTDFGGEVYTHPALRPAANGWFPDIGKIWKGYPGVTSKNNS